MEKLTQHPNALLMRKLYEVFANAIPAEMATVLHEGVIWHMPGNSVIAGEWKGIDGVINGIRANAMKYGQAEQGLYGFEPLQFWGNDEYGMSLHRDFYKGTDNHFNMHFIVLAKVDGDKIIDVREIPFDLYENDRFWKQQQQTLTQ